MMPSVAYARMMNCEVGAGEGVNVGSGLDVGKAGVVQAVNRVTARNKGEKKRTILSIHRHISQDRDGVFDGGANLGRDRQGIGFHAKHDCPGNRWNF